MPAQIRMEFAIGLPTTPLLFCVYFSLLLCVQLLCFLALNPYFYPMQKKLFLLDAFALVFRAYYALIRSPRITSKGRNTNAQFGFTNTLIDLINNQKPTHMAVCFDTHAPTERHTDFADYKANRQETPEDILSAVPDIKRIIEAMNIPVIAIDGYEADDVIGALAQQAEKEGYEVFMVTPDKDYMRWTKSCLYYVYSN